MHYSRCNNLKIVSNCEILTQYRYDDVILVLRFLNFLFDVYFNLEKVPHSPLIVNCNKNKIYRNIGLIRRKSIYCVPELKLK